MKNALITRRTIQFTVWAFVVPVIIVGCGGGSTGAEGIFSGVVVDRAGVVLLQEEVAEAVTSAPASVMDGFGLVGALGGARVRVLKTGVHEVLISMPQVADNQIPLCYAITTTPPEAGTEFRLRRRDDSNVVVAVKLNGSKDQEIVIDWSSVVLIAPKAATPDRSIPESYLRETSCVQSGAEKISSLAGKLWPENGKVEVFAANIQKYIGNMKQEKPFRSMDALGILDCGVGGICTGNANLAAALLRSKKIPARSIAVIPPTDTRLEMHRVVEYFENGRRLVFDPSSFQKDVPMKPWQNVIMAKTTTADEEVAMEPRMGSSLGCPYGQEIECPDGGLTPWGADMSWTTAKPLARFEAGDEAVDLVKTEWNRFLEDGRLSQSQIKAASTRDAGTFLEALKGKVGSR